jgi:hypothetical protein
MASVDKPRYGVKVKYTNNVKTTLWFQTKEARDRKHRELNRDPKVNTATRTER